ncbi:MAG: DUF493 domain-containing protein [Flavobacteriaceae bacterium]|jgi:putative lipoic acid-binding regulatory protein
MKSEQASNEFYEKLKAQLYDTTSWPSAYLFKFIIETDQKKINHIERIFSGLKTKLNFSLSKNGKYTSISINTLMKTPEDIIHKYKEVSKNIEGVISL